MEKNKKKGCSINLNHLLCLIIAISYLFFKETGYTTRIVCASALILFGLIPVIIIGVMKLGLLIKTPRKTPIFLKRYMNNAMSGFMLSNLAWIVLGGGLVAMFKMEANGTDENTIKIIMVIFVVVIPVTLAVIGRRKLNNAGVDALNKENNN